MSLTLAHLSAVNRARCARWHDPDTEPWTGADWSNAMCGEAGEAANVVKKLRRHETRTSPAGDPGEAALHRALADEIADVLLYLDLLANHYGLDLEACVVPKFNRVSERQGFPERLDGAPDRTWRDHLRDVLDSLDAAVTAGLPTADLEIEIQRFSNAIDRACAAEDRHG